MLSRSSLSLSLLISLWLEHLETLIVSKGEKSTDLEAARRGAKKVDFFFDRWGKKVHAPSQGNSDQKKKGENFLKLIRHLTFSRSIFLSARLLLAGIDAALVAPRGARVEQHLDADAALPRLAVNFSDVDDADDRRHRRRSSTSTESPTAPSSAAAASLLEILSASNAAAAETSSP